MNTTAPYPQTATQQQESLRTHDEMTIAVVLTWVEIKNAEYEIVQRFRIACNNIGIGIVIIDNDGYKLWSNLEGKVHSETRITENDCDFVISLHFESPHLYDVFSYVALWNPPEFYLGPGYERTVLQLASHDAVLSCSSTIADDHARNIFRGFGRPLTGALPTLFHSVPAPYLPPSISETSRLFYIGINWERITGERGRHHDLLELLDEEGLIDIYGPRVFLNSEPWRGFKCYRDEIPFDGQSVVSKINESGICLALSSESHQKSGIMSNRLFEGLAAGAVIIANANPFIDKYFADCVYIIDDKQPPQALANQVRDLVLRMRRDPASARERALLGQRRFIERFTLERCLQDIISLHKREKALVETRRSADGEHKITVIIEYHQLDISLLLAMIANVAYQRHCLIDLIIVCDQRLEKFLLSGSARIELGFARSVRIYSDTFSSFNEKFEEYPWRCKGSGNAIANAISDITTPFFCFLHFDDQWFSQHLSSLAIALNLHTESFFACSGKINEDKHASSFSRRCLEQLRFDRIDDALYCTLPREVGRFLYRTSVIGYISDPLVHLLDGFHGRYLNVECTLRGPLAQTCQATYVHVRWKMDKFEMFYSEFLQSQFVMDAYRGDQRWIERAAQSPRETARDSSAVEALSRRANSKVFVIETDRLYGLLNRGEGTDMMVTGFSQPEDEFTWIDGLEAQIAFWVKEPTEHHDLCITVGGRRSNNGIDQALEMSIDGEVHSFDLADEDMHELRFPAPSDATSSMRKISVGLRLKHAEQVSDSQGVVVDHRHLGLRISSIGIFTRRVMSENTEVGRQAPGHPDEQAASAVVLNHSIHLEPSLSRRLLRRMRKSMLGLLGETPQR